MVEATNNIEYKINPDLPILKEGWKGNTVINGRFDETIGSGNTSLGSVLKWIFSRNPQRKEKRNDTFKLPVQHFNPFDVQENSIVWFGHASFLINVNGVRLITDPCFFNLATNKRKITMPCPVDLLKSIDYLLVSHDHRDHFDRKSVEVLVRNNPEMKALIPLGGNRLFSEKKLNSVETQEAGWYQEYKVTAGVRIIFLPAKHWGRRGQNDQNKILWGSFLIIVNNTKIFFAGDSAYDEQLFKEIKHLFGDIDICLLPIGAYIPQWFMSRAHVNPEEAAQAFLDLGGKWLIPYHYGTYELSDEPIGEPLSRLQKCAIKDQVRALAVGEEYLTNAFNYEL
jgi:L-ascorbate metabolism protein UlaG (beta-lactamase superfamily)